MPLGFSKGLLASRLQGSKLEIVDQAGAALNGVTVTTSANANISLTYNSGLDLTYKLPKGLQVITASKAGYVTSKTTVNISGVIQLVIKMADTADIQSTHTISDADTQDRSVTNTARADNNARVDFPAGAIVDSNGDPVSDVTVSINNISISDPGSIDIFPGTFIGNDAGTLDRIESFGFMNVSLTDTNTGAALTLDPAKGATVRLPVDPDPDEDVIPTYRLDESTGQWILTGEAHRISGSNVFEFRTTTFSWLNLDRIPPGDCYPLEFEVLAGPDGDSTALPEDDPSVGNVAGLPGQSPVAGATVSAFRGPYGPITRGEGVTNAQGFGTIGCVTQGSYSAFAVKGDTYYLPSGYHFEGTTIKVKLRPGGQFSIPQEPTGTPDRFITRDAEPVNFPVETTVDDDFMDYLITGVTSEDIDGAALTGQCAMTLENTTMWPYLPFMKRRRGGLTLNVAKNLSGADKIMNVQYTLANGATRSYSLTIKTAETEALKCALTVIGLGTNGTDYILFNGENGDILSGHKVRITLATNFIANQNLPYVITGVTSADISGASLTGNFTVVNGNPTANRSLADLVLELGSVIGPKTLTLTVTFADASTLSTFVYINLAEDSSFLPG